MSIKIEDGETLVGAKTFKKVASPMGIERSSSSLVTFIGLNFQGKAIEDIGFLDRVGGNNPEFLRPFLNLPDDMLRELKDEVFAESFPCPLLSSTIEGCVESGHDLTRAGARYNHGAVSARALATVTNSLAAIRWAVFEEKLVTLEELVDHLRHNFEGAEELRQKLIRQAPKYGNADPRVDELAVWVADVFALEARYHKRRLGGFYRPVMVASGTHLYEGRDCWATPDGRLARQPVSNKISPANGTEVNGMTAVLHSVAAASFPALSNGSGHNMNLNPMTIRTDEGLDKFASLIEAYFEMGGRHIQFNPMSRETLLDAQKNPKDYPDLMVKVSGYSYRFVDLSKALPDDIINRTEFDV